VALLHAFLADLVVVIHLVFVAFAVLGALLAISRALVMGHVQHR
jgi:hypothetical protein